MGACCVKRDDDRDQNCLYPFLSGSLRVAAQAVPRHLTALRLVCDSKVPAFLLASGVQVEEEVIETPAGPLTLEWVLPTVEQVGGGGGTPAKAPACFARIMLYMHGGAFVLCTPGSLRGCTSPIARALGAALCVPEYRRPPEHSIASAVEDGLAVYRHLLQKYPEAEIMIGGESAGGGLAASMLASLRGGELPFPSGALLVSPWTDLSGEGPEAGLNNVSKVQEAADYLPLDLVAWIAKQARGDLPMNQAPASPVYVDGSLEGLPPVFVLYGKDEVLCGQIERFCEAWEEKGAAVTPHGVPGGVHAPVLFNFCHSPSKVALEELAAFFGPGGSSPARAGADAL